MKKIKNYIKVDLWNKDYTKSSKSKKILIKVLKGFLITVKHFNKNKISTYVTSLTFFTIISVVPFIAFGFGITKGFGLEKVLENILRKSFAGQEEILDYLLNFSNSLLDSTKGGLVALVSMFFLLFFVLRMIKKIEDVFNVIWNVRKGKKIQRKFFDYLIILGITAVVLLTATGMTVFIKAINNSLANSNNIIPYVSSALILILKILPYLLLWFIFVLLFIFLPNTKVKISSALIAGILAGTSYQLTQWGYISLQIGVGRLNAIYGSFAALPLFLIWIQISWYIILFSAQIAYVVQNFDENVNEKKIGKISVNQRRWIVLLILNKILSSFKNNENYLTVPIISKSISVHSKLTYAIISELIDANLLVKITNVSKKECFIPSMIIENYDIKMILQRFNMLNFEDDLFEGKCSERFDEFLKIKNEKEFLNKNVLDIKI